MTGYKISREIIEKLENYVQLLDRWHRKINLISSKDFHEVWPRHINDSLQLLNLIENKDINLIDIGTGAGFPGLILSIAGIKKVILIESNVKKAAFLLQASKFSDNEILILNKKVELLSLQSNIITTRGFSKLSNIFEITKNYKITDKYLLLKGIKYNEELEQARHNWSFDYKLHNSITSQDGRILEITNVVKKI